MWKYIITWCIVIIVQDPCPNDSVTDEFGRLSNSYTSCLVFHAHEEADCSYSKIFYNKDSARLFYNKAKKLERKQSNLGLFDNNLDKVNIDSIKI